MTQNTANGTTRFYVFGLADPAIAGRQCQASFDEATLKYKSAYMDWLDDGGYGVDVNSRCIWGHEPLGLLTVPTGLGTVSLSSPKLLKYIRDNTAVSGGQVTFVITRVGKDDDAMNFAARESGNGPTLSWTDRDTLLFAGGPAPDPDVTGPQQFNGTLSIPLAGGSAITFPNASVTATYEGRRLKTFSGVVGVPQLPSTGIFSVLNLSGPQLMIGYDYPSAFDDVGLPLDPSNRYFYVRQDTGLAVEVANLIELSPPVGGTTVIAIDPSTKSFLSYSNAIPFGPFPIEDVAVGFSGESGLLYTPYDNGGVENVLTPFGGNVFLGGTLEIGLEKASSSDKVDLSASLHGEAMVNADVTGFATAQQDWLRRMGYNGSFDLSASMGDVASVSFTVQQGSATFERYGGGSYPRFAFAGTTSASQIPNLPFQLIGQVHSAGVIDMNNYGLNSFMEFTGRFSPFSSSNFDLDGRVRLGVTQASFSGQVRFLGSSMECSAAVSAQKLVLSGKIEHDWTKDGWGIKISFQPKVTLTPGHASVEVEHPEAKACVDGQCVGAKVKEVGFNVSTGHFRICVGVDSPWWSGLPDIGETCQTI
ncbi:MAG: hypothetical protein IRZ16_13380 [Myxococcaceae bacterium]|nr:hypothetical protein [Myxococcaceae bacterium]